MAQKRREEWQRLAREGTGKKKKKPRSGFELFYGKVLQWDPHTLEDKHDRTIGMKRGRDWESSCVELTALPARFNSIGEYYDRIKPLIMAEARGTLRSTKLLLRGGQKKPLPHLLSLSCQCIGVSDPPWPQGPHELRFKVTLSKKCKTSDVYRAGMMFLLFGGGFWCLATLGRNNSDPRANIASMLAVLPDHVLENPPFQWHAEPLESLLALQRIYEACCQRPNPAFLPYILAGRRNSHIKFSDLPSEEVEQSNVENDSSHPDYLQRLNSSQLKAVQEFDQNSDGVVLVQGPPGTGKTEYLVALLIHIQQQPSRVLVTAPSNKATCFLLQRYLRRSKQSDSIGSDVVPQLALIGVYDKIVNLMEEETFSPGDEWVFGYRAGDLYAYTLIERAAQFVQVKLAAESNMREAFTQLQLFFENRAKSFWQHSLKELIDDVTIEYTTEKCRHLIVQITNLSQSEEVRDNLAYEFVMSASMIFCTLGSAGQNLMKDVYRRHGRYDAVLVDEAGQAVEAELTVLYSYMPNKLLLCGDPQQLPATTFSQEAVKAGYSRSLLSRMMFDCAFGNSLLDTQYRMNPPIAILPNSLYYDGKLKNGDNVTQRHMTSQLCRSIAEQKEASVSRPFVSCEWFKQQCVCASSAVFVDIPLSKETTASSKSIRNPMEAEYVVELAQCFVQRFLFRPDQIVVISLYSAQVAEINHRLSVFGLSSVKCHSVDSFQGSESDIVILSIVRANGLGTVGFARDFRRLNVALTRAKQLLVTVGNSQTFRSAKQQNDIKKMLDVYETENLVFDSSEYRLHLEGILSLSDQDIKIKWSAYDARLISEEELADGSVSSPVPKTSLRPQRPALKMFT